MVDIIVKLVLRLRAHTLRTSSSSSEAGSSYCDSTSVQESGALCTQHFLWLPPLFTAELTVDPGFNEPLNNEALGITSDIPRPSEILKYMERKSAPWPFVKSR